MDIQKYLLSASLLELFHFFGPRLIVAVLCGAIVGIERELKAKSAGLRTCILICLGSTLFASVAALNTATGGAGDPTRIAAQIVSGIGFLGGGVILQSQGNTYGVTTAAAIWIMAAIGVAIAVELYPIAIFTSIIVVAVLVGVRVFEDKFIKQFQQPANIYFCEIVVDLRQNPNFYPVLKGVMDKFEIKLLEFQVKKEISSDFYRLKYKGDNNCIDSFIADLNSLKEVKGLHKSRT